MGIETAVVEDSLASQQLCSAKLLDDAHAGPGMLLAIEPVCNCTSP